MPPRKTSAETPTDEAPGFEASLERLEAIVHELEGGELTLEESLARYEEGMRLSQRLTRTLDEAERRIERLHGEGEAPGTRPFEPDAEEPRRPGPGGEGELPF
jgi:exodeoxyribonuclease VII small subunit